MDSKFNYFIERTEKDILEIKESNSKLHDKVDKILEFKWQIVGGATIAAAMISILVSFLGLKFKI